MYRTTKLIIFDLDVGNQMFQHVVDMALNQQANTKSILDASIFRQNKLHKYEPGIFSIKI